ncbi:hypothetical protein NCCP1664_09700 [Zafaria cholistanensis]|uniref:Cardiolipin synthase N-terminal domain-containing protein n=1 Tax=Zafaria cholistanensis TaxID=1682741 RepID=A0A5A7NNE5_9MICC|nr:PLDc N-terminal domain-containing protein [Zafaria cholistanensis]GER22473.1 hypothetical protein NCCP1664_09700 [Zafaria cholistanensis]
MVRNLILVALVALAVTLYALIECVRTRPGEVRSLSKPAWVLAILLLPLVGAVLWFWLGRPRKGTGGKGRPAPRPRPTGAPDDDEQFLRTLEARRRQKAREEARAEEQRRREAELRDLEDKFKNPPAADSPDSPSEK